MFKKIAAAAALLVASTATFAADPNTFYAGADLGKTRIDGHKETSYGAFAGYNVTKNFAVEAGYRRLGEDDSHGYKASGDAWTVSGIASMPVGESFSVFGRLGVSAVEGKVRYGDFKDSNTTTRALIGAGVGYAFTPKVAGRVEFQKTGSGIRNLSAGVAYQF